MHSYTIFFVNVNAIPVSGCFSAHHQELKNSTRIIWYMSSLLVTTASGSSKQGWHIPDAACRVLNLLNPNDIYICRITALTFRRYILNIYSTNIHTEYCKHAA